MSWCVARSPGVLPEFVRTGKVNEPKDTIYAGTCNAKSGIAFVRQVCDLAQRCNHGIRTQPVGHAVH